MIFSKNSTLYNLFLLFSLSVEKYGSVVSAFTTAIRQRSSILSPLKSSFSSFPESESGPFDVFQAEQVLKEEYSIFYNLIMSQNPRIWKEINECNLSGFTLFCVPNYYLEKELGKSKLEKLVDDRNSETVMKIAEFHCVTEPVTSSELFNSGGLVTLAGVVEVSRGTQGGFFGIGGKEDGTVLVGGAKLLQTIELGGSASMIHEMDSLISPDILWRYVDQLRIPGSQ